MITNRQLSIDARTRHYPVSIAPLDLSAGSTGRLFVAPKGGCKIKALYGVCTEDMVNDLNFDLGWNFKPGDAVGDADGFADGISVTSDPDYSAVGDLDAGDKFHVDLDIEVEEYTSVIYTNNASSGNGALSLFLEVVMNDSRSNVAEYQP